MRKLTIFALVMIVSLFGTSNSILDASKVTGYRINSDTDSYIDIEFNVKDINISDVSTEKGMFTSVTIDKGYLTSDIGAPALPAMHELIAMPYGAEPQVEIVSYESKIYKLSELGIENRIAPAQPSYSKSSKPEDRLFTYNESAYTSSKFNDDAIATVSKSGTMRGVGVGVLKVNPFKYNPTEGTIEVYNNLQVRVNYVNADPRAEEIKAESYSPYFESSLQTLINYQPSNIKADLMNWPVTYLIIASSGLNGNADLQRLIDWKTEKGFNVLVDYVTSATTIFDNDNWVETQWNTLNPKPSFVLLIGDEDGTFVVESQDNPALGSTGSVSISDLEYGVIGATGSSNRIPSMYVGRFSVRTTADLTTQVDKTIWYEKEQFTTSADLNYLTYTLGVAGVDSGFGVSHGNPQINYGWTYYFTTANGMPNAEYYLYPDSDGSSVPSEVVSYISNGANFYNYTAHGMPTYFADPAFTIANIDGLNNSGKYPLVVGNCCLTNSFGEVECFGEAWLNAPDKGAIGYIGASMSTYWDEDLAMGVGLAAISQNPPPLDTNNPGMYDGAMALGYASQAATKHVGLMAVEALGTTYVDDYWSSYHLMGDPSVMIYFGIPAEMSASHDGVIAPGATTYTVTTTPYAYVAMGDQAGVLHGAAQANSSGVANVSISTYTVGDTGKLVITAQFKQPYFEDVLCTGDTGGTYSVNQSNMNYGNVTVGGSSTIQFTISNSHNSEYLMGDITTITGYTVALAAKNILSYSVGPNDSKTFDLVFEPTAQTSYNGNITITTTDTNHSTEYIAVTGAGALPDINVVANISASAAPEATTQGVLDVENTGLANLTYNATYNYVSWPGMKADVIVESNDFESGLVYTNVGNWTVVSGEASVTIQSLSTLTSTVFDASVATDLFLDFDHANLVRTAGYFQVEWSDGSTWTQVYNGTSTANGSEHIAIPNTAVQLRFIANVTRSQGQTGWQTLDNVVLSGPILIVYDWLRLDGGVTTNGVVSPSGSDAIVVDYDATGCPLGVYTADITITSDDPDEPSEVIAVEFTVSGGAIVPDIPHIVTSISGSNLVIDWDVAADATGYDVYSSDDPYGTFTLEANVSINQYTVATTEAKMFYYIVATNATK